MRKQNLNLGRPLSGAGVPRKLQVRGVLVQEALHALQGNMTVSLEGKVLRLVELGAYKLPPRVLQGVHTCMVHAYIEGLKVT